MKNYKICKTCKVPKALDKFHKCARNRDGLKNDCKSCRKEKSSKRYKENKHKIDRINKLWREKNPSYNKMWRKNNSEYISKYKEDNKDRDRTKQKQWRKNNSIKNSDCVVDYNKRKVCPSCGKNRARKFFNKDITRPDGIESRCRDCKNLRRKETDKIRHSYRMKNDIHYRLSRAIRSRFKGALKRNSKSGSAILALGCSIEYLKKTFRRDVR